MKRKITLSIALALSIVLVTLTSSDSTVTAQNQMRLVADTGIIKLGPNQVLHVMVDGKFGPETEAAVRFRRIEYTQDGCSGGVCKQTISSQTTSAPVILMSNEAASIDISPAPNSSAVRAVVLSNRRNMRATAAIINSLTGEMVSHIIMANTEGDF